MSEFAAIDKVRSFVAKARSIDELASFGSKKSWLRNERPISEITDFLSPHSQEYFSILRPLFLHQLKSIDALAAFSPVLVRDGLVAVARFFCQHPVPTRPGQTLLLLNPRLSIVVPDAWRECVAFYETRSHVESNEGPGAGDLYGILTLIDEQQASLGWVASRLAQVAASSRAGNSSRVKIVVLMGHMADAPAQEFDRRMGYLFGLLEAFRQAGFERQEFAGWESLRERELVGARFLDLNQFDFYYSDSFVTHQLLRQGAMPFFSRPDEREGLLVPASLNHSFALGNSINEVFEDARSRFLAALTKDFDTGSLQHEERSFTYTKAFSRGEKLSSRSFERLVYETVRVIGCSG